MPQVVSEVDGVAGAAGAAGTDGVVDGVVDGSSPSPRLVWLASYPKSGNTWVRSILTALSVHRLLFDANHLGSGAQPHGVAALLPLLGLDPRWLSRDEVLVGRDLLVRLSGAADPEAGADQPIFRKTHERWRPGPPGAEPFVTASTRAAIHVTRDPRDIAGSYASFFGIDLDEAVRRMGEGTADQRAHPFRRATDQPWDTWTGHTRSWQAPEVPFPVHLVRYEDLKTDAVGTLLPVLEAVGQACTHDELERAVDQVRFDRLQEWEQTRRFRETSPRAEQFFRTGLTGGWRTELDEGQVRDLEADHGEVMAQLGYEPVSAEPERAARADVRRSRRRQAAEPWWHLPPELGLEVEVGTVPDEIAGATEPRPWIWTTADQTLVRFSGGGGVWVREGRLVTVQPSPDGEDSSWLLHGWAVTLATLQRGGLSLHAATVGVGDRTVAVAGRRGAGKSTTAMALRRAGHRLLVDDVTLVEIEDGGALVRTYPRNVHLLPDAAAALGLPYDAMPLLGGGREKVAFRPEDPAVAVVALDAVVILVPASADRVPAPELEEVRGRRRVQVLRAHTSRDGVARVVLGDQAYFDQLTRLAASVPVFRLRRPVDGWSLDEVVGLVEEAAGSVRPATPDR